MRYIPETDRSVDLETLVQQSREVISRLPLPAPSERIWNPLTLTYNNK